MPHLSPTTLTTDEQRLILRATAGSVRDHLIYSLALGTGLRLAEIVGLDVGDVFLPDRLAAKLKRFWRWKRDRGEDLSPAAASRSGGSSSRGRRGSGGRGSTGSTAFIAHATPQFRRSTR